jgi:hypothetical protein
MSPLIAVFVPTFAGYALSHGMLAIPVIFSVGLAAKRWVFPFQEATVAMSLGFGAATSREVMRFGIILTMVLLFIIIPVTTVYWMAIGIY